jgi:hypothetical protein
VMMTDDELRELSDKWERWARYGDASSFTADDAEELLGEVRELRVQQVRLVALVRQARDRLTQVNAHYRELIALPGVKDLALAHLADQHRHRQDVDPGQLPGQLALDLDHDPDQLHLALGGEFDAAVAIAAQDQAQEDPP